MSSFTPKELSAFVAQLPEDAEVMIAVNAGRCSGVYWTPNVLLAASPSATPEHQRFGRAMLMGLSDVLGGPFPPEPQEPVFPVLPPTDGTPTAPGH